MKAKKIYQKPTIIQVKLVPEEAVLAGCKAITAGPQSAAVVGGSGCTISACCYDVRS